MRVGSKVKIEDIGPLATCVSVGTGKVELELEGERFWMPAHLVSVIEEVA